jgi:pyruvate,orthophosphate dikinase
MARLTGNPRFVYDSYRRFVQMFSDVVMGLSKKDYEVIIDRVKKEKNVKLDIDLNTDDMKNLTKLFKAYYKEHMGKDFPESPKEQLMESVKAVFRSWNNERAIIYRRNNDIPSSWGTAVNVQSMVFGNMGEDSGTGVAFTRNPSTGENKLYGEFLMNAQGEDVVAGIRTPQSIQQMADILPDVYKQFTEIAQRLESHYRDMQDMEFTIERGKLYMLQTRNGKRTAAAALKVAVDLVAEKMCTKEEVLLKVEPRQLDTLLHPQFDATSLKNAAVLTQGLPASPGAATGAIVFNSEEAVKRGHKEPVILVRQETSPEDIEGMYAAQGVLTSRGGMTSHAAVVARGMGTCCVAGAGDVVVHEDVHEVHILDKVLHEGDYISIDGSTGKVYLGKIATVDAEISGDFGTFMKWADDTRRLKVRANADTPADAAKAVSFGAEGIGLTRTEHMFFNPDRIPAMREMIVSDTVEQRRKALSKLLPMQKDDFIGIYKAMGPRPVTIRLLDPPLHEFLPHDEEDIRALAKDMNISFDTLSSKIENLHEFNPMMGHRGCRLAVTYPEIAEMQTQAIIEAAIQVNAELGIQIVPEIMVPLVGAAKELGFVKDIIVTTADRIIAERKVKLEYLVGTMIEIPRAAVTADEIATEAQFFSFGTNDLTQMTFGFSRDDAGKFLDAYYKAKIFEQDPFARFDQEGTGKLVQIAVEKGRATRPDIKLGVCGEHGGDPSSIEFFDSLKLNYVSCSPFRVPIARLAAAQAAIKHK